MTRPLIDLGLGTVQLAADGGRRDSAAAERRYGPPTGFPPLRAALAELEGVDAESLMITTGASMGLAATLAQLSRPGSVLLPRPYYPSYPGLVRCLGFEPRYYELLSSAGSASAGLDLDAIESELGRGARAIIVNSPGNPLGNLVAAAEMRELLDLAGAAGCLVISDEVYADFVYDQAPTDWRGSGTKPHLVRVRSFSKTYQVPGERIGYVIAEPELVGRIGQTHWLLAMSPPVPGQMRAAQALLERRSARFEETLAELRRNRDLMAEALAGCGGLVFSRPRAGIFYWIEVVGGPRSAKISRVCLERAGVRVTPGLHFGVGDRPAIRCSFALAEEDLREALGRLVATLQTLRS